MNLKIGNRSFEAGSVQYGTDVIDATHCNSNGRELMESFTVSVALYGKQDSMLSVMGLVLTFALTDGKTEDSFEGIITSHVYANVNMVTHLEIRILNKITTKKVLTKNEFFMEGILNEMEKGEV